MRHTNPETHTCYTCGYVWKHGVHGGHDCIGRVQQQRDDLLGALIEHQELTRPIQRSIEAIASSGGNKHVNAGTEGHIDHALAIKDLNRLRQFYTREGAINLIKEYWPDLIQLYIQREELIAELNSHHSDCMRSKAYRKLHWPCTCEAITKAGESK